MTKDNFTEINRNFEEKATEEKAKQLGFSYLNLEKFPINPDILKFISADTATKAKIIPFDKNGKILRIAIVEPQNPEAKKAVKELTDQKYELEFFLCSEASFNFAFKIYDSKFLTQKKVETRQAFSENEKTFAARKEDFAKLEKKLPNVHAEVAMNEIEILAIKSRATDIHLQPDEKYFHLRFRVDGILYNILKIDPNVAKKLISHIKYIGGMVSNISDVPQDGRLEFMANNRQVDVRISVIPTKYYESVVMRILDTRAGIPSFKDLGFDRNNESNISEVLKRKEGLCLVTGPTGSGKTTTLYSMLKELNSPDRKLVTLEDPIEYQMANVTQSQINPERNYHFSNGLRSLLRHDPDVILIGEIRDTETARLATEASLTGHAVLSSIHTNSAPGAISRLRNLGIENFTIAPTINAIFAQRLVRRICPHCAKLIDFKPDKKLIEHIERIKKVYPDLKIPSQVLKDVGCEKCSDMGYNGLVAVAESFLMNDNLRRLILEGKSEVEISKFLREEKGFLSIFEDGLIKAFEHRTSIDEIARVV